MTLDIKICGLKTEEAVDKAVALGVMVSELVTNVGLHARTEAVVRVSLHDGCLRVEVSDRSAHPIEVRQHAPGAETGRGLRIVEALAADWGVDAVAGGKTVWFEVPVHPRSGSDGRAGSDGRSAP